MKEKIAVFYSNIQPKPYYLPRYVEATYLVSILSMYQIKKELLSFQNFFPFNLQGLCAFYVHTNTTRFSIIQFFKIKNLVILFNRLWIGPWWENSGIFTGRRHFYFLFFNKKNKEKQKRKQKIFLRHAFIIMHSLFCTATGNITVVKRKRIQKGARKWKWLACVNLLNFSPVVLK